MSFERDLIPCSTTLIIVPDGLLEHWAEKFRRHISLEVFADDTNEGGSHGVAYIGGVGDISTARFPLNHKQVGMASAFHLMGRDVAVVPFSRNKEQYHSRELVRGEDSDTQSSLLQLRWFRIVVDETNSTAIVDLFHLSSFIVTYALLCRWKSTHLYLTAKVVLFRYE